MSETNKKSKKVIQGIVVSDKMQKTIVVQVDRRVMHSRYKKYLTVSKKYKAHDEKRDAKLGDRVEIIESKPISKNKRWALKQIVEKNKVVLEGADI